MKYIFVDRRIRRTLFLLAAGGIFLLAFFAFWNGLEKRVTSARENERIEASPAEKIPSAKFLNDYPLALKTAAREQKPLLLFFMESDCPFSCRMMDETFSDRDVTALCEAFCVVRIDLSRAESELTARQFDVTGSPTVQFLSAKGQPLRQISGFQTAEELKSRMETVLSTIAWHQTNAILR